MFRVAIMAAAFTLAAPLFNGTDLSGWEGNGAVFRVSEGAITGGSLDKPLANNEFLASEREFGDFELRLQFKITGDPKQANAGVQIRSQRVPNHHEMVGYQADIGQHYWGCLYDESRRNKILQAPDEATRRKAVKEGEWNEYRIRCEGPRIRLWLNGVQTVDYTEDDPAIPLRGRIGLQVHSGPPMMIQYKEIVIEDLENQARS